MLSYMAKSLSRGFRRRFHEAAMGEILRQLEYKCAWVGRTLIKVDRWFPSSKRCSNPVCHHKNTELKLKDRAWVCRFCHTAHERDDNAAFNLWQEGWRLLQLMQPQSTSCPTVGVHGGCAPRVRGKKTATPGFSKPHAVPKREKSSNSPLVKPGMEPGAARVG